MRLGTKQKIFARRFAELIAFVYSRKDHAAAIADVQRSVEEATRKGKPNSNHVNKLAGDLDLFKWGPDGTWHYQRITEAHAPFGRFWTEFTGYYDPKTLKRYSTTEGRPEDFVEFCWGGAWDDGNHYSIRHKGVK